MAMIDELIDLIDSDLVDKYSKEKDLVLKIRLKDFIDSLIPEKSKEFEDYLFENYFGIITENFPVFKLENFLDYLHIFLVVEDDAYCLEFDIEEVLEMLSVYATGKKTFEIDENENFETFKDKYVKGLETFKKFLGKASLDMKTENGKFVFKKEVLLNLEPEVVSETTSYVNMFFRRFEVEDEEEHKTPNRETYFNRAIRNVDKCQKLYHPIVERFRFTLNPDKLKECVDTEELVVRLCGVLLYTLENPLESEQRHYADSMPIIINMISKAIAILKYSNNERIKNIYISIDTVSGKEKHINSSKLIPIFENYMIRHPEYDEFLEEVEFEDVEEEEEEVVEEVKKEKFDINDVISNIEDLILPEIVVNVGNKRLTKINDLNKFCPNNEILEYLKQNQLAKLIKTLSFIPDSVLADISLESAIDDQANVVTHISFESLLLTLNKFIVNNSNDISLDGIKNLEQLRSKVEDSVFTYGDLISRAMDGESIPEIEARWEEHNRQLDLHNKVRLNYTEFLNYMEDLILKVCDSIDLIKNICNEEIDINMLIDMSNKDSFYLSQAFNLFNDFRSKVLSNEKIKKESYLLLAKYIEALRTIPNNKEYDVKYNGVSAMFILEEYDRLVAEYPEYDIFDSLFYDLVKNKESVKKLMSSWNILPSGKIERLEKTKIHRSKNANYVDNSTFGEKYDEAMKRKEFLDNTECIHLSGTKTFAGYSGYYYSNGLVIFEKFFDDEDELVPAKSNATYLMNIDNFADLSCLTKPEVMDYIKDGNTDVKRVNHTSTWETRIQAAIDGLLYSNVIKNQIKQIAEKDNKRGAVLHG